jgi:putative hemin transport protein
MDHAVISVPAAPADLVTAWQALRLAEPKLRIRDAAERLGVSEAALRATECGGTTTRLVDDWPGILRRVPLLGEVMALTRNASAVHEKIGEYRAPTFTGGHGLVLGTIDLRLFLGRWAHGFAVVEGEAMSLQFFDAHGEAVHKIHTRDASERAEFLKLSEIFRADDQRAVFVPAARPVPAAERADAAVDGARLRGSWLAMRDTHEFFGILRRHEVTRLQALRLAPEGHARRVVGDALDRLLVAAAGLAVPVMIFVGNPGCIQIHSGPVARIVPMGPWINVLDPGFNLHLRRDRVDQAWVVRKPTSDGPVCSLELFDAGGETIAMVFGERKPGQPELAAWRDLLDDLPELGLAGA